MATLADVAKQCRLSRTTVSMVLNEKPLAQSIPENTKARIRETAARLGYHPNPFAQALRSQRSHTVGVMVPDVTDPYCAQILRGLDTTLSASGYLYVLADIQNNPERLKSLLEVLLGRGIEGLIVLANSLYFETSLLETVEKRNVPSVVIGRQLDGSPGSWVATDNEAGAHMALQHLYDLGHRRIGFLKGPQMIVDTVFQWKGVCSFAQARGLDLQSDLVVELKNPFSTYEGGYEAAQELLNRGANFTALMAFDDMAAFGAARALASAGIRIPDDCSVIGFDDIPAAAFHYPSLSTVREGMQQMGSMGAEILLAAMEAHHQNRPIDSVHRKVKPQLIVRESTGSAKA